MSYTIIDKVKDLKNGIHFENSKLEMDYTLHKFFDIIIHHRDLINDEIVVKIPVTSTVIPTFIDIVSYIESNKKVWSQEYKVHFDLSIIERDLYYFLKFEVDRKTKPSKVFKKEYSNIEIMKEIRKNNNDQ